MIWWYVAAFFVALVVASALAPKPQSQPPAGLGDITAPTAEEGREIPVLFGTRLLTGPNVVWYGDFSAVPVKSEGGKK
jgi:hypothetical protein